MKTTALKESWRTLYPIRPIAKVLSGNWIIYRGPTSFIEPINRAHELPTEIPNECVEQIESLLHHLGGNVYGTIRSVGRYRAPQRRVAQ